MGATTTNAKLLALACHFIGAWKAAAVCCDPLPCGELLLYYPLGLTNSGNGHDTGDDDGTDNQRSIVRRFR